MTEIDISDVSLRSDMTVELVDLVGSDETICKAARVSTLGSASIDSDVSEGLIRYLLHNRHGSPFEHGLLMFRISAPIVVWREFMRHRIGFSYNEQSGRYMEMESVFYIPNEKRKLVQKGKAGHYNFYEGSEEQHELVNASFRKSLGMAWSAYSQMLNEGVSREVARMVLPLSTYSTAYVSCNPRSLMSFLSLRTLSEDAKYPSNPMWEIHDVATQMEAIFVDAFPQTHKAFVSGGRVAP